MLSRLCVRDIVLIENADITLGAGLSVLTGETGAGKSIVLDALGLALGRRGDASLVRAGAQRGSVTAFFALSADHGACVLAQESGISHEEGEPLILRRVQEKTGATRAFLNDQPVGVGLLRSIGELLVDILGQNDVRGLLDPKSHRAALDAFGDLESSVSLVREMHKPMRELQILLETRSDSGHGAEGKARQLKAESGELDVMLRDLETLAPVAGEDVELARERSLLKQAASIEGEIREVARALASEDGLEVRLGFLLRRLARISARMENEDARLESTVTALERALPEVAEARAAMDDLLEALEVDPERLETVEQRLFSLRDLARKHGVGCDELPDAERRLRERRRELQDEIEELGKLQDNHVLACNRYEKAAEALSKARQEAASQLEIAVTAELKALRLAHMGFRCRVLRPETGSGPGGRDRVRFEVAPESGTDFDALSRIASGGELSRFMLALQAAIVGKRIRIGGANGNGPACLIFDEIDQGIGGAVADAVGARLQQLARATQVLVVTHAPQIAARASKHFRVSRDMPSTDDAAETNGRRETSVAGVAPLGKEERREEIARMLAGAVISEEARAAAARLLQENAG